MNIKVINVTHGLEQPYYDGEDFMPIATGGGRTDILCDDMGEDNISVKNPWYGELTAIYWAWKNLKDVDVIGLSHYRRYLFKKHFFQKTEYTISWERFLKQDRHLPNNFLSDLNRTDIILPRKWIVDNVREQFLAAHPFPYILEIIQSSIKEIHPESLSIYEKFMNGSEAHLFCIFMTRWSIFQDICNWMFPLMFEIEKRIKPESNAAFSPNTYQSKILAFIWERLVNVCYISLNLKIMEYPFFRIDDNEKASVCQQEYDAFMRRPKVSKYIVEPVKQLFGK